MYFVACLLMTMIATERKVFTYGQMSLVYLPLLVVFCFWQVKQFRDPNSAKRPSKVRMIVSVSLSAIMAVLTVIYNVLSWLS